MWNLNLHRIVLSLILYMYSISKCKREAVKCKGTLQESIEYTSFAEEYQE
jgi:hypothetical protein